MLTHTGSSQLPQNELLWKDLVADEILAETKRIILCDLLQTVQNCLASKFALAKQKTFR